MTRSATAHPTRSTEAFYGRRRGPGLSPTQKGLLEKVLPPLKLDPGASAPGDLRELFRCDVDEVRLEIGFGGGEHLLHRVRETPRTGFIGVEPFVNGMVKLLTVLADGDPGNLRLYDDDAVEILDWLPSGQLAGIDLLYPDPWPKPRHFKRRFLNARNLDRMARVLRPGARLRFASDIESYVNWTLRHVMAHPGFVWCARRPADWHEPYAGWPGTRYEAKALGEGRRPAYLTFERRG